MKRLPIPQAEFGFTGEAFNLAGGTEADGARVQAERDQSAENRATAEKQQRSLAEVGQPGLEPGSRWNY